MLKFKTPLVIALMLYSNISFASLVGQEVSLSAFFPNKFTVVDSGGTAIVSSTLLEYPAGFFESYNSQFSIDILGNSLVFLWLSSGDGFFSSAPFNGLRLEVLANFVFTTASVDLSSAFSPVELSIEDNGSVLFINFAGLDPVPAMTQSVINFQAQAVQPVPLPGAFLLFAGAILSLKTYKIYFG